MMRIHVYEIDLQNKKIEGPFFINIDFIVNRINAYNLVLEGDEERPSGMGEESQRPVGAKQEVVKDYKELLTKHKHKQEEEEEGERFKVKMFSLQNYYYASEVLIIFDGFKVYKYIEDKTSKYALTLQHIRHRQTRNAVPAGPVHGNRQQQTLPHPVPSGQRLRHIPGNIHLKRKTV
jgi:hypothetical protein